MSFQLGNVDTRADYARSPTRIIELMGSSPEIAHSPMRKILFGHLTNVDHYIMSNELISYLTGELMQ